MVTLPVSGLYPNLTVLVLTGIEDEISNFQWLTPQKRHIHKGQIIKATFWNKPDNNMRGTYYSVSLWRKRKSGVTNDNFQKKKSTECSSFNSRTHQIHTSCVKPSTYTSALIVVRVVSIARNYLLSKTINF